MNRLLRDIDKVLLFPFSRRFLKIAACLLAAYLCLAYLILPALWKHYEHHPALEGTPKTTFTHEGIPGDPLNVGFVGEEPDIVHSMSLAGWLPADPITLRTSARITTSSLLGRPFPNAPVSNLYVWSRVQDLAFEQQVPGNTRQRHHVRLWKSTASSPDGRPVWLGAATFDRSIGVSHLTGKITHHIAADIDQERDKLFNDFKAHGQLVSLYQVTGVGSTVLGRNGGGDRYYTDGELTVGVLSASGAVNPAPVTKAANPPAVKAKNKVWAWIKGWVRKKK